MASDRFRSPQRIGPYTIEGELGRGGMGVVYRARDPEGRPVAVKVLLLPSGAPSNRVQRFEREQQVLASIRHPHVVRYVGASPGPPPWLAMELVEGSDLKSLLEKKTLSPGAAIAILAQVAAAVAHAHERDVIHRDLKPANILVRKSTGDAIVTDFGLAKDLDAHSLTQSRTLVGTLAYMSPEQIRNAKTVGPPTDVWAIGLMLYEVLTGKSPFAGMSELGLVAAIESAKVPYPRRVAKELPASLEALCAACLSAEPEKRPSASEVADALASPEPDARGRSVVVVALALALVLVGTGGVAAALRFRKSASPPTPTPAPSPPSPVTPWPVPEGWRPEWDLGSGARPALSPRALWTDEVGREAEPLRGLSGPMGGLSSAALAAAYRGRATLGRNGRVSVEYDPLRGRAWPLETAIFFHNGSADAARVGPGPPDAERASARVLAPNDVGNVVFSTGDARWTNASLRTRVLVRAIDMTDLWLRPGGDTGTLALHGRRGTASTGNAEVPFRFPDGFLPLAFAPGAVAGSRVAIGGEPQPVLDAEAVTPSADGPADLLLAEADFAISSFEVEGVARRPDVAALAVAPGSTSTHARIAAAFERAGGGEGGPILFLDASPGDLGHDGLSVELDEARLTLAHGARPLATLELTGGAPRKGWLLLERAGDRVRGAFQSGASEQALEVVEPLPLPRARRAAYGSTGPRVRFSAVVVLAGPEDAARLAHDRGDRAPESAATSPAASSPAALWRSAALALARASDPALADPSLVGPGEVAVRRRRACVEARDRLAGIFSELGKSEREDALARSILASVLAGEGDRAQELARRLVAEVGLARARALVDALEWSGRKPCLVDKLSDGLLIAGYAPAIAASAAAAAEVLAPEKRPQILEQRAMGLRDGPPPADASTEEGRDRLEKALELLRTSASLMPEPSVHVLEVTGTVLDSLGRPADAVVYWEKAAPRHDSWWAWLRLAGDRQALGQEGEALEAAIAALANAPGNANVQNAVLGYSQGARAKRPGTAATGLLLLSDVLGARGASLRGQVPELARFGFDHPGRDTQLACYALTRTSEQPPEVDGEGPLLELVRALRANDDEAARLVSVASERDPLARAIARLDPRLSRLKGR